MQEKPVFFGDSTFSIRFAVGFPSKFGEMLKGAVNKVILGAKKSKNKKKVSYLLTYKGKGNKTRTVYVAKERVSEVKEMIAKYKKGNSHNRKYCGTERKTF